MSDQKFRLTVKPCRSCGKKIVFLPTPKGKVLPVNWDSIDADDLKTFNRDEPVLFRHGKHVAHFSDCPDAQQFRKQTAGAK